MSLFSHAYNNFQRWVSHSFTEGYPPLFFLSILSLPLSPLSSLLSLSPSLPLSLSIYPFYPSLSLPIIFAISVW